MEITKEQSFEMNNLISKSGKFKVMEFQKALMEMVNAYKDFAVGNGEYMITTTKAIEVVDGEQVMDVEILMPVSYRMPVEEPYVFKNKLKLNHALYAKVTDITKLQDTMNEVNQYILEQKLQPLTSAYLIQTKQENQPCIELYIGINPNVL